MQDLEILNNSYLIIGGPATNKSAVSLELSKQLGFKLINLDREKHAYFNDFTDYDSTKYYDLLNDFGIEKAINYIHKYEMKHLNYVLDNLNQNVVIDFGNTYTLIDDKELLEKIKLFKNIILLNPTEETVNNSDYITKKLYNNKIIREIYNIKIDIENKSVQFLVKEIINHKNYREVL